MASSQTLQTADFQPIPLNICVTRGDSPIIPFKLTNSDGSDLDINGGTFTLTVSTEEDPSDNTNQVFQVTGVIVGDGSTGEFTFQPTTTDTGSLDPDTDYFHDVRMVLTGYGDRTIFKGQWQVSQDINKDA